MHKGSIITIIVVVVLVGGGLIYWYSSMQGPVNSPAVGLQPATTTTTPTMPVTITTITTTNTTTTTTNTPALPATVTVTYTDSGFSPATVTIPKGGTVIFKNMSSNGVWVASDPHPLHNGYPTTGGCVGSTFDSCSKILSGNSWPFTFTFVGSWGYHNHLNPGQRGTVVVQ
jgi:plastocyanin